MQAQLQEDFGADKGSENTGKLLRIAAPDHLRVLCIEVDFYNGRRPGALLTGFACFGGGGVARI